ncbi:MAG: glycosyltransferase [Dehalococcoidia bacterium]
MIERSIDDGRDIEVAEPGARRRVLHLINGEYYAGAERVQDLLALRLPDLGYEVSFAALKPVAFASRRNSTVPIHETPMKSRVDGRAVWSVTRLLRDGNFDLVHTHTPRTALVGSVASRLAGVPMVHHVHSPTVRDSTRGVTNRINAWTERMSLRNTAAVIACSGSMAEYATRIGIPDKRLFVIPNGVPGFGPLPVRAAPSDEWVIGTAAFFRPRKGIELLIAAVARLRAAGAPVRLRLVGGFESEQYRTALLDACAAGGLDASGVDWVPFTTDVGSELRRMDVYVLPSLFGEGLSMALLEAMAAGAVVVATDVEGVREAVRHGVDGLVVQAGSEHAIADALSSIVSGDADWATLRMSAFERHAAHFSDARMAAQLAEAYENVLRAKA